MTNLLQQAVARHQAGKLDEAELLYNALLTETPRNPDALALLGVIQDNKGHHDKAVDLISQAIAIDAVAPLFKLYLGNALMNAKRVPEAINAFRQFNAAMPQVPEGHYNLANALRRENNWAAAIASYETAISLRPAYAEAYMNLALTLVHQKQYDQALIHAMNAVVAAPNYADGWLTLCSIAEQCKQYEIAADAGKRNAELSPQDNRAWFGYGVALNRLDRHEEAILAYKRALEIQPNRADIWDNLAQTYQSLNRLEEAEATFRKTVDIAGQTIPDEDSREVDESEYGNRHWHLALIELLRGKYKQGFARYRSRFGEVGGLERPNFSRPIWKGEDINGKTLVVCDEQGFGDTLMLARYLPLLKKRGAKIIFSIHPVLEPLFKGWHAVDGIVLHGGTLPAYDYHTSVFDLPHIFGTELDTIPSSFPYLPFLPLDGAPRITDDGRPKVGVVWGGSPLHLNDSRRSIPLAIFKAIFNDGDFRFFSFNRDMKPGDAELLPQCPVTDLAPRLNSFADAARLIGQMDLIITCDTATAHLAGGLDKPVWVLLPYAPDWRWLTDRDDSPWYPKTRLFRQPKIGDWVSVIETVRKSLREMNKKRVERVNKGSK